MSSSPISTAAPQPEEKLLAKETLLHLGGREGAVIIFARRPTPFRGHKSVRKGEKCQLQPAWRAAWRDGARHASEIMGLLEALVPANRWRILERALHAVWFIRDV